MMNHPREEQKGSKKMLKSSTPFFSAKNSTSLQLPDAQLELGFDGSMIELTLGGSPPRMVFLASLKPFVQNWEVSEEIRFVGVVARMWRSTHEKDKPPLNFLLLHYQKWTIEIRFALLPWGLAGSYQVHEGLFPLALASLGFRNA